MSTLQVFLSSVKMALATFCSRILGLVREQLMAAYFGASGMSDAFLVAYRIPNLLRDLLAEGAFSSAFVPTFVEANHESKEKGRELLWELFGLLGITTGIMSLGIAVFAPELVRVFAPSFIADPEKFELTVQLTRIMSPFLLFISLAALFMGSLNSLRVFFIPALAPAAYNVASIIAMVTLTGWLTDNGHNPVLALGIGAFFGGLLQAAVQVPLLFKRGYGPKKVTAWGSARAKKIIKLLGPGLVGFAATQINLLITTILATGAAVGATSWLNYAFRLFQLPVGILSVSLGNSNLVHFSSSWKQGKKQEAITFLESSYYLSFLTIVPATVLLYLLSEQAVNIIYERGMFTRESTQMTAMALRWYALGIPCYGLYKIWLPTFYAIDRQKIPVIASICSVIFNTIFCWTLTPQYGFVILAMGTSLSMLLNCVTLGVVMRRDLELHSNFFFSARVVKTWVAGICMAIAVYYLSQLGEFYSAPLIMRLTLLTAWSISGVIMYGLALVVMGERQAVNGIMSKFLRRNKKQ